MENVIAESLISKALKEYDAVREELNRPQEDLVMIAACELVKKSIADFLAAFLFEKGIVVSPQSDLLRIQDQCIKIDKRFKQLDLASIAWLSEDSSMIYTHTLEDRRLSRYARTMEKTREFVLDTLGKNFRSKNNFYS